MRKIFVVFVLFVSLLGAKEVSLKALNNGGMPINVSINDKQILFKDAKFRDKYIILEFFSYRCPTCYMEIPHLNIMNKDNPFVKVVGVHMADLSDDSLDDYILSNGINYPVVPFSYAYDLYNYAKYVEPRWGGGIPFTMLINKQGKVLQTYLGVTTEDDIMKYINIDRSGR